MFGAKLWVFPLQGGSGSVQGIQFSNIQVSEVQVPIVIDQFYCDKSSCKNQSSAVALSGINYERIKGTYTVKPIHLACSDNLPCTDVTLTNIELTPLQEHYHLYEPFCWQTFGELRTPSVPPINCLQIGKPLSNRIQSSHDSCWRIYLRCGACTCVVVICRPLHTKATKYIGWYFMLGQNRFSFYTCYIEIHAY